ncbi:hypothetical protein GCM10023189_02680 [Nibrella saemangeumensis]|uniref:Uncharacterized protein n=1 Tax=Nibrella saemangeumensis TaxID=1084526 RepID=A0ABP8M9K9_9BACT
MRGLSVSPVLHRYAVPALAVNVTDCPALTAVAEAVIVATGGVLSLLTSTLAVAVQPMAAVTVTE